MQFPARPLFRAKERGSALRWVVLALALLGASLAWQMVAMMKIAPGISGHISLPNSFVILGIGLGLTLLALGFVAAWMTLSQRTSGAKDASPGQGKENERLHLVARQTASAVV